MPDRHDQCIFYILENRILKFSLYGKDVNAQEKQRDEKNGTAYKHKSTCGTVQRHTYAEIAYKNSYGYKENHPYNGRLAEIFAKRPAEVFAYITFSGSYAFHTAVIKSCCGRAYCNDWNTVDQP